MKAKRPTRDDVAALAGVSSAVVSYVLNDGPRPVAEEKRERVLRAVDTLGYRPNDIARSLAGQRTGSVGVIAPTLANPVWARFSMGVTDVLSNADYLLMVCDVEGDAHLDARYAQMMVAKRVDGCLLAPTAAAEPTVKILVDGGVPTVVIEHDLQCAPSVLLDAEATGRLATEYLIGLGHRRIAILREQRTSLDSWRRYHGYEQALRNAGIEIDPRLVADAVPSIDGSVVAGSLAAAESLLDVQPRPTAVFAHNDLLAIAVMHVARTRGLRIPEDLSVVGVDDIEAGRFMDPPLTTAPFPAQELGQVAAEKLLRLIEGEQVERVTTLPAAPIIARGSATTLTVPNDEGAVPIYREPT
jgi:DNA-binding LacI/PurR family transcriptional regulator